MVEVSVVDLIVVLPLYLFSPFHLRFLFFLPCELKFAFATLIAAMDSVCSPSAFIFEELSSVCRKSGANLPYSSLTLVRSKPYHLLSAAKVCIARHNRLLPLVESFGRRQCSPHIDSPPSSFDSKFFEPFRSSFFPISGSPSVTNTNLGTVQGISNSHPRGVACHNSLAEVSLLTFPDVFSDSTRDLVVMSVALILAYSWVRVFDELARNNLLEQKLSRKLVHISTGLLFMMTWPLFSPAPSARLYAAVVPALNVVRLLALGTGVSVDEAAVRSISRGGERGELLGGPLYYVAALTAITISFWMTSPVGAVALALMCGGDGLADIVGRRVPSSKLPWNHHKSWAGSAAMFASGSMLGMGFTYYFGAFSYNVTDWTHVGARVVVIALVSTIVESLPITDKLDDNLTVPLSAILVGAMLFPAHQL